MPMQPSNPKAESQKRIHVPVGIQMQNTHAEIQAGPAITDEATQNRSVIHDGLAWMEKPQTVCIGWFQVYQVREMWWVCLDEETQNKWCITCDARRTQWVEWVMRQPLFETAEAAWARVVQAILKEAIPKIGKAT